MQRSEALGERRTIELPGGRIGYFERGSGPAVVFVHGLLVNAELWRGVVGPVADAGYRCLALDLPFGSHEIPMPPQADLTPPGAAALIADFLAELDLTDVTLVANDTGGAITQLVMTTRPERIGRVVLTPSDCFEHFFPPMFAPLPKLAAIPGAVRLLTTSLRAGFVQRLPMAYGLATKRPITTETMRHYVAPSADPGVRRDLRKFLRGVHRRYTIAAAERLPEFDRPVLLAWASEDRFFPLRLARRLAEVLPDARLRELADCRTFVPEDVPGELAELIVGFAGETAAPQRAAGSSE
jgi:pimeloyl-ACP methyl ester carboxylesterase